MTEPNELGKALKEWWDSDAFKEMQKANEEAKQRAVGKYFMLSEEDKIDMVEYPRTQIPVVKYYEPGKSCYVNGTFYTKCEDRLNGTK